MISDRATEVSILRRYGTLGLLAMLIGVLAFAAAGCGGSKSSSGRAGTLRRCRHRPAQPLEYNGKGDPDVLIATDFPMQGSSRTQTLQIVGATKLLLQQQDWKAGDHKVAMQVCDDSTAQAAKWDPDKCSRNAHAYAQNESLIGVIGTFNSGCAAIEIPVLNQAPGGGLMLLSPANTYGCLTEPCAGNEPEKYYPSGKRNYARVAPSDPNQGAVMAEFAKSQGVNSIYILNDKEAYGLGVAKNFRGAAEALGMKVLGFAAYDPKQANFQAIFTKIKATNPDGIFIGGLVDENSGQLINDKVAVLGPNTGVKLFLPDGFTTDAVFQRSEGGTPNAKDAFFSVAGVGIDKYTGAAADVHQRLQADHSGEGGRPVCHPWSPSSPGSSGCDRELGRQPSGRHRRGLQDQDHQRSDRQLRDQRERRHHRCEGCRPALHDLQGHEQARDLQDGRPKGEPRRGRPQSSGGLST